MNKLIKILAIISLSWISLSCNNDEYMNEDNTASKLAPISKLSLAELPNDENSTYLAVNETNLNNSSQNNPNQINKKLIKKADLGISTNNLKRTQIQVRKLIEHYQGYIEEENSNSYDYKIDVNLNVRIPVVYFNEFIDSLQIIAGEFLEKNIQVQDVTSEFIDIESRIKTKKELEKRYLEILSKAKSVTEILEVERELGKIREEIESVEQRLNYLSSQSSYSKLDIYISQLTESKSEEVNRFVESLTNGWNIFVSFLLFIISIWPFVIISITLLIFMFIYFKKRKIK